MAAVAGVAVEVDVLARRGPRLVRLEGVYHEREGPLAARGVEQLRGVAEHARRERLGLVNSADAWTYSPGNTGLFGMSALAEPGKFESARDAMLAEIEQMKREPVSPEELIKAVKQFTAATLSTRKTMQGQAQDLGSNWLAANDLNFSERYLGAVKRATAADLQRGGKDRAQPEVRPARPAGARHRGAGTVLRYHAGPRADRAGPAPRHGLPK